MQALCIFVCLLAPTLGAEYALKFLAANKSRIWIGDVVEAPLDGTPLPCRPCAVLSELCYPNYDNGTAYVYYPTSVNLTNLNLPRYHITLETWVRFDELNSTTHLISVTDGDDEARNNPSAGFRLGFYRGFPTFGVANTYTTQGWPSQDLLGVSGPEALQWVIGRWYHIAGTFDGVYRRLYVDGELMDAYKPDYASYYMFWPIYTTAQFSIGASAHCDLEVLFSGAITEMRMWNVSRSASEIKTSMNVRAEGNETGLIGLWREMNPDNTVLDLSGNQPVGLARAVFTEPLSSFPPPQSMPQWITGPSPCKNYTGGFCSTVVDYPYFSPNNTWSWRISTVLNNMGLLRSLASPGCYAVALKHLCTLWYPRCLLRNVTQIHQPDPEVNYTVPVVMQTWVPMPVAREECLSLGVACEVEFNTMINFGLRGALNLAAYQIGIPEYSINFSECTGSWLLHGNDSYRGVVFPWANASTHTYGSLLYSQPFVVTNDSNTAAVIGPVPTTCEYPFISRPNINADTQQAFIEGFLTLQSVTPADFVNSPYCTQQCPPPLMLPAQYVTYTRVTGGMAVFSLLFSTLIAALLLRDPQKRVFPGSLMVLILGSVMGLSFALSLSLFGGWDNYFCLNEHTVEASQGDSALCDTQAIFVQFFLATTQGYWCAMCLFLYHVIRMKPSTNWIPYTVIPLLPALFSVILLASLGKMGLASSGNICWVKSGETALVWCLYYAPGLLNVIFSMYIIISYARNRKGFKTDAAFLRMLQITGLLLISSIFSFSAQTHVSSQFPHFIEAVGQFLSCRNLAMSFVLVRDLHPPGLNNTQQVLDTLRAAGGFDMYGNASSCKPFDSGFVVGVFYVDQIVFSMLGTLVPLILILKQFNKVFCYERWSVRSGTGSSKTLNSSRSGIGSELKITSRSLPRQDSDLSIGSRTENSIRLSHIHTNEATDAAAPAVGADTADTADW